MSVLITLYMLAVVVSAMLPFMGTPYSLGSAFMFLLMLVSVYTMSVGPLWYPAAVFLIYVGALMVLFLYMSCLSPNMRVKSPRWALLLVMVCLVVVLLGVCVPEFFVVQTSVEAGTLSEELSGVQSPVDLNSSFKGDLLVFSGVLLFFGLLSVVKVCKYQKGPLRPFKRSSLTY